MSIRLPDAEAGLRRVFLRDLVMAASIGVFPHEHEQRQRIRVNVELGVADPNAAPGAPPVGPDELGRVVDYTHIADTIRRLASAGHVRLVETLAERIAAALLADSRVRVARVRVEKLDIFRDAEAAGVEIERLARD
jgi:7,8-dihydroneopterin aldolase/epimerase/oxygenase